MYSIIFSINKQGYNDDDIMGRRGLRGVVNLSLIYSSYVLYATRGVPCKKKQKH